MVQCWLWLAGFVWQRVWTSTWLLEWKFRGRLVLRDVQNGPSEMWHESVELECGWRIVLVAGFVAQCGPRKPGMTDFFHVGRLIPRPQMTEDLNDSTCASAAHTMVTSTWMNTNTELEILTFPVFWFNTVLCDYNGKTIGQKLWVSEQMDCGRAGLDQVDTWAESGSVIGGVDGTDGFDGGVDGGFDGFDGGFDGLDGFDGGVDGMVEVEDIRAQNW